MYLAITIDTECDRSANWSNPDKITFRGVTDGVAMILNPLFQRYKVPATYFLSHEVLEHAPSVKYLKSLLPMHELATHLHGDFNQPQIKPGSFTGALCSDMQWEYSSELEFKKLEYLTRLFSQKFGQPPLSFRAGRFGAGNHTGTQLLKLGYKVDSSVTPHIVWQNQTGVRFPDYRRLPENPYFVNSSGDIWQKGDSPLLEIPITIRKTFGLFSQTVWFRPSFSDLSTLKQIITQTTRQNNPRSILVMMFHNVEVIPGASPYTQTQVDVAQFMAKLEQTITFALQQGFTPITLATYYAQIYRSNI